jgi:tetrahydromethanopterin S-methyltransferase subunit B
MKKTNLTNLIATLTVTAALAVLAGCATKHNYQQGAETGAGLMAAADKVDLGVTNIDQTLSSLNDLVNNPSGNLEPKLKAYNDNVTGLQTMYQNLQDSVADARNKATIYVTNWDAKIATIMNPDIKNAAQQRRDAVQTEINDVKKSYAEVRIDFDPFMANLKDIQTALNSDLTAGGVSAVKGAVGTATTNGDKLKSSLGSLATDFRQLGTALGSTVPTNQVMQATSPAAQ